MSKSEYKCIRSMKGLPMETMSKPYIVWIDEANQAWSEELETCEPYISISSLRAWLEDEIAYYKDMISSEGEYAEGAKMNAEKLLQWLQPEKE